MNTYILLFGITGDLSKRMLLPSLEKLLSNNMINNIYVYGVSRRDLDVNEILTTSLNKPIENISLSDKVSGIKLSDNLQDYIDFKNKLNLSNEDQLLIYLSVPPTSALQYVEFLGNAGLNGNNVKLMLEKPFGTDYASANNFLSIIAKFYREEQVYKIDHYLAKRNAQALLEFRKNNENNLRNYWNDQYIEKIEVIAAEALDIQGRGVFYEQTGALCDFIQGHLFELLLLTIIDIDKKDLFEARSICAQSLEINNINNCVRGQYLGYKEEVNNTMSYVETYAKVILSSNMNEWKNTEFVLLTGKALDHKESSINIYFKDGQKFNILISPVGSLPNKFNGEELVNIDNNKYLDGYEAVFYNAIRGNRTIFSTTDEILASWKMFMPLLDLWHKNGKGLIVYPKGSTLKYN
ncbi:MAG: hypothetical protein LBQ45_00325 [Mycoplasmataceae bacterium]|nr:hypothetical protein [Mycoplasmataceae bacterium]